MASVKELMLKEIEKQFDAHPYAFFSTFEGVSVADMTDYRRTTEKVAGRSMVIKHSMAKKLLAARQLGQAESFLKGSVVVTFAPKDPQNTSKAIVDFVKTHEKFVPAGMIFENAVYGQEFVKRLAVLPSRHELLTQVAVRVKSPISGFVSTLAQLTRGLVVAINEIKKKKEAAPQAA